MDSKKTELKKMDYYNKGKIEAIDVINDWDLNFNLGSVIKYIARCDYKEDKKKDLTKARNYIEYELERIEEDEKDI